MSQSDEATAITRSYTASLAAPATLASLISKIDVCGGVRLVESLGDDDLGEAGPDGGDGCAETPVVECGAALGMTSRSAT
jgi:hypothetical protein